MIEAEMRVYVFTADITDDINCCNCLSMFLISSSMHDVTIYLHIYIYIYEQWDKCTANKKGGGGNSKIPINSGFR
jgi:hypothetical protein